MSFLISQYTLKKMVSLQPYYRPLPLFMGINISNNKHINVQLLYFYYPLIITGAQCPYTLSVCRHRLCVLLYLEPTELTAVICRKINT